MATRTVATAPMMATVICVRLCPPVALSADRTSALVMSVLPRRSELLVVSAYRRAVGGGRGSVIVGDQVVFALSALPGTRVLGNDGPHPGQVAPLVLLVVHPVHERVEFGVGAVVAAELACHHRLGLHDLRHG